MVQRSDVTAHAEKIAIFYLKFTKGLRFGFLTIWLISEMNEYGKLIEFLYKLYRKLIWKRIIRWPLKFTHPHQLKIQDEGSYRFEYLQVFWQFSLQGSFLITPLPCVHLMVNSTPSSLNFNSLVQISEAIIGHDQWTSLIDSQRLGLLV